MSARDVIENCETVALVCEQAQRSPLVIADGIVRALTAAGYRILGPDEVDPVTREKCAALIEQHTISYGSANALRPRLDGDKNSLEFAAAIRSLGEGR